MNKSILLLMTALLCGGLFADTAPPKISIGTLDANTKSTNGASVVQSKVYMQTADATHPGLVGISTQTFAGAKTFTGPLTFADGSQGTAGRCWLSQNTSGLGGWGACPGGDGNATALRGKTIALDAENPGGGQTLVYSTASSSWVPQSSLDDSSGNQMITWNATGPTLNGSPQIGVSNSATLPTIFIGDKNHNYSGIEVNKDYVQITAGNSAAGYLEIDATDVYLVPFNGTAPVLRLDDANGAYAVGLRGPLSMTNNVTYTLPGVDGSDGQFLKTNGSGILSWATASGGSGANVNLSNITATNMSADLNWSADGTYNVGNQTTRAAAVYTNGIASVDNNLGIWSGNVVYQWPTADGNPGDVMTTDGAGTLSFAPVSGGVTTLAAVGSSPNANGATISGSTLNLEPADATHPGVLTAGTQSIGGAKSFPDGVTAALTGNASTATTAAAWTTARNLAGNSVDGSANVPFTNKFIVQGTTDSGLSGAQFLGALGTGIVKNTTTTGVLSIAVAGDFPTLNQNTTGTASNITASSNSSLTTLSSLSLPASQLSGTLAAAQFPALTGDVTTSAGALATTLATVNSNTGSFGSSTAIPSFTVNDKGLITAASTNAVVAPAGTLTGGTLSSGVTLSSLTSVGTITSGTWSGTAVGPTKGGTGLTSVATGDLMYGSATNTWSALAAGTSGKALVQGASIPSWTTLGISGGGTGQTTAQAAIDALLPSQTGNSGKALTTDGSTSSWTTGKVPVVVGTQSGSGLSADVSATTVFTPSAAGYYRATCYTLLTTAGTTSTLPSTRITYTQDENNTSIAQVCSATSTTNTLNNHPSGSIYFRAKAGVAVQAGTSGYASSGTTAVYSYHIVFESMD